MRKTSLKDETSNVNLQVDRRDEEDGMGNRG